MEGEGERKERYRLADVEEGSNAVGDVAEELTSLAAALLAEGRVETTVDGCVRRDAAHRHEVG